MAKGDDAQRRKRNRAHRKKMNRDAPVSAKVAAVIAAKKRRKAGKRRICEGMCFSLPTPEDPFNDRHCEKNDKKKRQKKDNNENKFLKLKKFETPQQLSGDDLEGLTNQFLKGKKTLSSNGSQSKQVQYKYQTEKEFDAAPKPEKTEPVACSRENYSKSIGGVPKFLISCLSAIEKLWVHDGFFECALLLNAWGISFWNAFFNGLDILGTTKDGSSKEQIAWIVSTAADVLTRKEKEGLSINNPFLLVLVSSQKRAREIRALCKPLQSLGIDTVSIHSGALLDHQAEGLKSCEPEFLVSTPGRLLELVELQVVDISHITMLVIDALDTFDDVLMDELKSVRKLIFGDPQTIILSDSCDESSILVAKDLLKAPFKNIPLDTSALSE